MTKRRATKNDDGEKKSFWTTLPGVLTALATLITAIVGMIVALNTTFGLFSSKPTPSPNLSTVTASAAETPTLVPPPAFTTHFIIYPDSSSFGIEEIGFEFEQGMLPEESIKDFLRLSRVAYGDIETAAGGFDIQFIIHNTGDRPLILDLDQRFFSLIDDQGQSAELIYFCCASKGGILQIGQERTVRLIFGNP